MNNLQPNILQKLIYSAIALLVLSPAIQAAPEEPAHNWYTVEVISFTRTKTGNLQEKWLAKPVVMDETMLSQPDIDQQRTLPNDLAIQKVPDNEWQLARHAYSLGRSPELTIQSHQAWRQPGLSREESPWINLASESSALTGKIKISLSRYLHADIDITLSNPDWSPTYLSASGTGAPQYSESIHFQASRRLKRDEIHYIDHPLAGVLVRIERFEMPKPAVETDGPVPANPEATKESNSPISDKQDKKTDT